MKLLKVDTVEEVKIKLEKYFSMTELSTEMAPLRRAVGRYLAEEIISDIDIPQFRRSVVDGFAVTARDTFGVSDSNPIFLEIIGEIDMGKPSQFTVQNGQTVYVPTGAMIPDGADAVVMIEYTEKLDDKTIAVYKPAAPNTGLMNQGDDYKKGGCLFSEGHRIKSKDIGMLAAVGKAEVKVYHKPAVSIISTGDEIIDISENPDFGQIRDINSYTLAALLEESGAEVLHIEKVRDIFDDLLSAVSRALISCDIVLLSGGSSAGNKDMTADIINEMGNPGVITHGIAMKPGKPTIIGVIKKLKKPKLLVGLPGHPMAAVISYDVIVDFFIKKYYFKNMEEQIKIPAIISENIHAGEGRETYQLVTLRKPDRNEKKPGQTGWIADPIHAKSGSISQLMEADGYVRMEALSEGLNANEVVEVVLLNR